MAQNQKPLFPQNQERLRRGITNTPVKYKVLQITQLPKALKMEIATTIVKLNTGDDAAALASRPPGWGYRLLDTLGRVGVLSMRGAEVALFYKRQISQVEVDDCDPVPEGEIKDPVDVWVRLDLMGLSARQVNAKLKAAINTVEGANKLNETEINAKQSIISTQEAEIKRLNAQLTAAEQEAARKRTEPGKHRELGQRDVMEGFLELLAGIQMGADNPHSKEPKLFKMLDTMGKGVIKSYGAEVIAPHQGDTFDPTIHEAIAPDQFYSENKISQVGSFGIKMHDILVKPARVIVGTKKEEAP